MKFKRSDIELMAPVGSYESLMAAIQGGADSVYFGIEKLNMRAKSSNNFTEEDLKEIVRRCNENNVKTYLTINTIIYDENIELMKKVVDAAKENNVTAIIASDLAVISYASSIGVEIHASTQLNISNYESLKFFAKFCDVVVTARELTLNQVKEITKQIEEEQLKGPSDKLIKIETFAHGALCMAVSGKCYLSLHEKNYSANRGTCLQTCRKAYIVTEKESGNELEIDNQYIMSPKDLKTIHFLNKVLDSGIKVLKFEGRARSPEYVKTVLQCYDEAVNAICDGTYNQDKIDAWDTRLASVFNRGFWDGYYLGQRLGDWSEKYGSKASKKKIYIAKCTNYFSKINVGEFQMESGELSVGDDIIITGPTTGVVETKVKEIRVDLKSTDKTIKGETFSIATDQFLRRSDRLYKLIDSGDIS